MGAIFLFQIRGSGRLREVLQSPSGLASSASSPLRGAPFARAKPAREASPHRGGGRAAAMAGGAFAVRGGRPRGKRYMGGNGKVEGRACPAPTGCHKWVADERGKGGRQPSPFAVGGKAAVPGSPPFPRRAKADDACAKRGGQRFYGEAVPGLRQRRRGGSLHGPCASPRG